MAEQALSTQFALELEPPVVERVSHRARRIRLNVRADGGVVLTIPLRASRTAAYQFLEQNRAWIARQRAQRRLQSSVPSDLCWNGRDRLPLRSEALREAKILLDQESARLGLAYRGLKIRDPRSRWGSCTADGRIMLSLRLLLAPPEVFRYVVIHELCHLRWRGHGPRFWALVAQQMPDFEAHRRWLRRHGDALQALFRP